MASRDHPQETPSSERLHPEKRASFWVARALSYVVYGYVVVTEVILGLGFTLLLFGANPEPSFVQWVYRSLDRAMEPFRGIFTPIDLGTTGNQVESVLDTSVLFAMIVYAIVAFAARALIDWLTLRIARLDHEEREHQRMVASRPAGYHDTYVDPSTPRRPAP